MGPGRAGRGTRRAPAARFAGASRRSRGARPAGADRSSGRQGYRAAPPGAPAIHRRHCRGEAPRLPVHQRGGCHRPALRHPGLGRRDRGFGGDLFARHAARGRRDRRRVARRDGKSDSAGAGQLTALPGGRHHGRSAARARWRREALSGADLDARLRFGSLPDRNAVHLQGSGVRHPERRHLPGGAQGHRPAGGAHGSARRRGRRFFALAEIQQTQRTDADRDRDRRRPGRDVHRCPEARDRRRRARRRGRAGRSSGAGGEMRHDRRRCPGGFRDRHRGADRYPEARARGAVRREQRLCGARGLQHAHAGDRDHAPPQAGIRLDHQPGHAERIEPGQEGGLRAALPRASQGSIVSARRAPRGPARAAHQPAAGDLRAVRGRYRAHGSLAWIARRRGVPGDLRQGRYRRERGYRSGQRGRRAVGDRLSVQSDRRCADRALSRRRPGLAIFERRSGLEAPDRCDRQGPDAAARFAQAGIHGACPDAVGEARPAADHAQIAMARLSARRLDRSLGHLRGARGDRRLGGDRPGDARPSAQRDQAGDAGA